MFKKLFDHLKPAVFRYNNTYNLGDKKAIGVMAQDIIKGLKSEGMDYKDFSIIHTDENGFLSVDYTQLIPVLISRIKDLEITIENLEVKVNEINRR